MQNKKEHSPKCLKTISLPEFELLSQKLPHIIDALSDNNLAKLEWLFSLLSGKVKKNNSLFTLGYSFCLLDASPQDKDGNYNIEVSTSRVYFYLENEEIKYLYFDSEENIQGGAFSTDLEYQLAFLKEKLQNQPAAPLSQSEEITLFSLLTPQGIIPPPQTINIANLFKYILFAVADEAQAVNLINSLANLKKKLDIYYSDILAYDCDLLVLDMLDAGEFAKAELLTRAPGLLYNTCLAKLYGGSPLDPNRLYQLIKSNIREKNDLIYHAILGALRYKNYKFALELINNPIFYGPFPSS